MCLGGLLVAALVQPLQAEPMQFGFSKVDVTPKTPIRLAGYGNRERPFEGVVQQLFTRTMALQADGGELHVLVSVDTIGFPGSLTTSIARRLEEAHGITRERFVLCCTHSHTAPHLEGYAPNLFAVPLDLDEEAKTAEYTKWLADRVVEGVALAIEDLAPGEMLEGTGEVGFAVNRRVLKNGRWSGFGVFREGPADHSLPVLKIVDADGKLRGIVFNYACHCTTLTGNYNNVSGDWAGYAAEYLEETHDGATALCTIGCGADANPEPRGELLMAEAHGRALSLQVDKVLSGDMRAIAAKPTASFGYAGLPVDRPELSELRANLESGTPQVKRHAQNMLALEKRMGRLPESYPMPIQTWQFGDDLTMVFLGGEVVVDYAARLHKELGPKHLWVTAYANDVFGYVASERMRQEGGYEFDYSMVYYNQPGPWEVGTEDIVIDRAQQILANPRSEGALSPEQALATFRLPKGFEIELVAAEPLIEDPVSFEFGPDGRLWVVEMGDYPRGEGDTGGSVKFLEDVNRDGIFDKSTTFIDGLSFPTGVFPWRKGVLVSCAPEIFYAEDTDGDGKADLRKDLFTGFAESNPQHRINGFAYGLDNWVYLGSGSSNANIRSLITDKVVNMAGRDIRIQPDEGLLDTEAGRTQYGRMRDAWGHWFGSENSVPIYHFVISDRYLRRNRYFPSPDPKVELLHPNPAPPVYPSSRLVDRFNDMWAANRFTSACAPTVFRDVTLGEDMANSAFVCEPVHNLVHRTLLQDEGVTFRGERHPDEQQSEFLSSTDVWSRPVKVATGPDGALWIADMYRQVIEHPQWIPEDWQARLNLYAGSDKGRIYRVYRTGRRPGALPRLDKLSDPVAVLESTNGPLRDMAQQLLVHPGDGAFDAAAVVPLEFMARSSRSPEARMHALCALDGFSSPDAELLLSALDDADPRVQTRAVLLCEPRLEAHDELGAKLCSMVEHPDLRFRMQLALTLGEWDDPRAGVALGKLALADIDDRWMRTAVLCSATHHAQAILNAAFAEGKPSDEWSSLVQYLIATALGNDADASIPVILAAITKSETGDAEDVEAWQMAALSSFLEALDRSKTDLAKLKAEANEQVAELVDSSARIFAAARDIAAEEDASLEERLSAIPLLARGLDEESADLQMLGDLLSPRTPPVLQSAAVAALASLTSGDVPTILLQQWRGYSPRLQSEILGVLSSRREWLAALLDALEARQIQPTDLDAATRERLLTRGSTDMRERAQSLLATVQSENREQVLAEYQSVIGMPGNAIRGAEVFSRRCTTCHLFRGSGNKVGPDLAALQDKSARYILTAVLDPNRAVEWGFRTYVAAMDSGRVFNGMIVAESTNSVTLAQADGRRHVLLRADLEQLAETGQSFMPEGLEKELTPQDLADIIAYVQSGPVPAGSVDGNQAAANLASLREAGSLGVDEVTSADSRSHISSWLGRVELARCSSAGSVLAWSSPPMPAEIDPLKRQRLRIPLVIGNDAGGPPKAELSVNETPLLKLDLQLGDAAFASADGRVQARFLATEIGANQASGVLEIELPGDLLQPEQPLQFELGRTSPSGWVGVLLVR